MITNTASEKYMLLDGRQQMEARLVEGFLEIHEKRSLARFPMLIS